MATTVDASPMPDVSVVVRTLGSAHLVDALASLEAQDHRTFEAVVVDMSGGASKEVLASFERRLPSLRRVTGARRSRPAALNAGIRAARAPVIAILDDDNLYDSGHLVRLADGIRGKDLVYTGVRHATFMPEGGLIGSRDVSLPWRFEDVLLGNYVYTAGTAFRRVLWDTLGGYDERFPVFEDWDFVIRAGISGRVAHLPGTSATSRKFTGAEGISGFERETADARRCLAGIYWKHRRLFRAGRLRDLRDASADHCRRSPLPRTGLLSRSLFGWRLELGLDLLTWWGRGLFPAVGTES
jgi:glycosyltransferase involved in cell wall biosynthesis